MLTQAFEYGFCDCSLVAGHVDSQVVGELGDVMDRRHERDEKAQTSLRLPLNADDGSTVTTCTQR